MSQRIENSPSPNVLMNSMRSIGYSFKTALADVIDNSISAGARNVYLTVPINDDDLFISILDDGEGMNEDDLFRAMRYGSDNKEYSDKDLGRFGLGLKSASLSQCRILSVASKLNGVISAFQWDLDAVIESKKWDCIKLDDNEINMLPNINKLKDLVCGTIVIWQNFDIAYKKSEGHIREYLSDEMDDAEQHISLVFHRFLNNRLKPFDIYINNRKVEGLDPFLEDHPKTDTKKQSELKVENSYIKVQPFILPHQSDLSNADIKKLGGIESLRSGQGFYIYRNDRLIIYGTWFRLSANNISSELYKYGRIKVDIPNALDETWDIDIKKQNATIPKQILNSLKKAVTTACESSKKKTEKRAKLTLEKDNSRIWNKSLGRDERENYFINNDSEFVKNFLNEFDDGDKNKILSFLEIISSTLPYDDIYNSVCNKKNPSNIEGAALDAIVLEGVTQFKYIKQITQKSNEVAFEKLCKYEPFNNEVISKIIWEKINEE